MISLVFMSLMLISRRVQAFIRIPIHISTTRTVMSSGVSHLKMSTISSKRSKTVSIVDMSENHAIEELKMLNSEINKHDILYYESNDPEISDSAYDKLVRRTELIVGKFNHLQNEVSKLSRVGGKLNDKFPKIVHSAPMLSLENAFSHSDLSAFASKMSLTSVSPPPSPHSSPASPSSSPPFPVAVSTLEESRFVVEPKIDGLSLSLRYEQGSLVAAATRGESLTCVSECCSVSEYCSV